jgi:hypothetical protein
MEISNNPNGILGTGGAATLTDRTVLNVQNHETRFPARTATVSRTTGETDVQVTLNLDGVRALAQPQLACRF